jgi:hypothetical protein
MAIPFADKCGILGRFWIEFREDNELKTFIEYNDVGLPIAYFIAEGLVKETPLSEQYINETFDLLLSAIGVTEEEIDGISTLEDLMDYRADKDEQEPQQ